MNTYEITLFVLAIAIPSLFGLLLYYVAKYHVTRRNYYNEDVEAYPGVTIREYKKLFPNSYHHPHLINRR